MIENNFAILAQEISEMQERLIETIEKFNQFEQKSKNRGVAMRKANTEMIKDRLNRYDKVVDEKLDKAMHKMESMEDSSKETNAKVTDITTRVLYFMQENAEYNKRPNRSSDSYDDLSKKKQVTVQV
jgi:vacuolar-type H+-ATPase subunit E/Vma4